VIITYFRSSSYNNWSFCQHQYYLTYVLGLPSGSGKKAEMGTLVHKVMEGLACAKKANQDGESTFTDEVFGEITFSEEELFSDEWMEYLYTLSYDYYSKNSEHKWTDGDRRTCLKWCYKALAELNGGFDPRKRTILAAEPHFDFVLPYDWAHYKYEIDGQVVEGQLALKGTIDLVTEEMPGIVESVDWKTGKCLDWATGQKKTYESFQKDAQLHMYHYALHKMYPHIEQFIPTVYWINDGGAYTVAFGPEDIIQTEQMIKQRFLEIQKSIRPSMIAHTKNKWKCKCICTFGKNPHPSGEINPRTGEPFTICEYVAKKIKMKGIHQTTIEEKAEGHEFSHYEAPGT